jgi:hypothetical protein
MRKAMTERLRPLLLRRCGCSTDLIMLLRTAHHFNEKIRAPHARAFKSISREVSERSIDRVSQKSPRHRTRRPLHLSRALQRLFGCVFAFNGMKRFGSRQRRACR